MPDPLARLRKRLFLPWTVGEKEALLDDREALFRRVEELEKALRPFAEKAKVFQNRESLVGPSPLYALKDEILEASRVLGEEVIE